jgi:hypothetical protein
MKSLASLDANVSLVSADSLVASETADSPFATDEDLDTGHLYTIKTRVYDPKFLAYQTLGTGKRSKEWTEFVKHHQTPKLSLTQSPFTTTTSPNYEVNFRSVQPTIYKPASNHCHHHKPPKHHQAQFF